MYKLIIANAHATYINILQSFRWSLNKTIILALILLVSIGMVMVISSSMFVAVKINLDPFYFIKNHILYLAVSTVVLVSIVIMPYSILRSFIFYGFLISIILLMLVFLLGSDIKGAKRWLYLGPFSLQPSELVKVFFAPFLALVWHYNAKYFKQNLTCYLLLSLIFVINVGLLVLQPDLGMAILTTAVFLVVLFITQISWWVVAIIGSSMFGVLFATYFLLPHVAYRINSFFSEQTGYQISKANQAILEGKIFGKGPGLGEVKQYLPDSHTDFIFTVAAEEFGLIFNLFIVIIYTMVVLNVLKFAMQTNDIFKKISLVGLGSLLGFQSIIHMASNLSLIPTKGMTLPIISYGGSSLLSSMILFGLLINLTKKVVKYEPENNEPGNNESGNNEPNNSH